jgi:hypothetical protein
MHSGITAFVFVYTMHLSITLTNVMDVRPHDPRQSSSFLSVGDVIFTVRLITVISLWDGVAERDLN